MDLISSSFSTPAGESDRLGHGTWGLNWSGASSPVRAIATISATAVDQRLFLSRGKQPSRLRAIGTELECHLFPCQGVSDHFGHSSRRASLPQLNQSDRLGLAVILIMIFIYLDYIISFLCAYIQYIYIYVHIFC